MPYQRVFMFVEGDDDERFVERVVLPCVENENCSLQIVKYAQESNRKMMELVKNVGRIADASYWVLVDLNGSPCVTDRKAKVERKYPWFQGARVIVVKREIEGWYLAGLDALAAARLRLTVDGDVEQVTKEQFAQLWGQRFDSSIECQLEVLEYFDVNVARARSTSFGYFSMKCWLATG